MSHSRTYQQVQEAAEKITRSKFCPKCQKGVFPSEGRKYGANGWRCFACINKTRVFVAKEK